MEVSFFPILPWLIIFVPVIAARLYSARAFYLTLLASCVFVVAIWLAITFPGYALHRDAVSGSPQAQFQYARWVEDHNSCINAIICWPTQSDVLGGFSWLQRAANQDYPPAVYALRVRLKHGIHVPRPTYWHGPAGNVFRQPDYGQKLIDKAISRGYKSPVDESMYYWHV